MWLLLLLLLLLLEELGPLRWVTKLLAGGWETASGWCFSSSEAAAGRSSAATRQVDDRKGKEECKDKEKGSVSYEKGPRAR